ncbi:MAG: glycosyltransferase [Candidatus Gracilibacteria bacterium]|nr:glycosyltransferase [Candidatus Gracilibacteria bacterium]
MKVAILHEMFVKLGGAEKVVEAFLEMFPEADLYTLIYDEEKTGSVFPKEKINPQVLKLLSQKIYNLTKNQRYCLPFMAKSIETLDFSEYDLVIASSSGFAHGAITKPDTKFVVYYHSPSRYMWDYTNEYKKSIGWDKGVKGYLLNELFLKLRQWDYIASARVDLPIMASAHVQKRIVKYYRRNDSIVLHPPVEVEKFINYTPSPLSPLPKVDRNSSNEYYITIAALTEWKRHDIHINAFNKMQDKKLKIVGVGNYEEKLKEMVEGNNIEFAGYKSGDELIELLVGAKGFIFSSEDDFGIAPIEAMACGVPVFGLKAGGLAETSIEGITGEFFEHKDGLDFIEKFITFEKNIESGVYDKEKIIQHAKGFSKQVFEEKFRKIIK